MAFGDGMVDGYPDGEEPIVFHHKNGEYRKRVPQAYRDLATGQNQPRKGLFRVLVSTRGNRMMFVAMALCFALVFVISLLTGKPNECVVNGVACDMAALSIDERVYVSVRMRPAGRGRGRLREADMAPRRVDATVVAIDVDGTRLDEAETSDVFDGAAQEPQFLRASFTDFEVVRVSCTVRSGGAEETITCRVEKR